MSRKGECWVAVVRDKEAGSEWSPYTGIPESWGVGKGYPSERDFHPLICFWRHRGEGAPPLSSHPGVAWHNKYYQCGWMRVTGTMMVKELPLDEPKPVNTITLT